MFLDCRRLTVMHGIRNLMPKPQKEIRLESTSQIQTLSFTRPSIPTRVLDGHEKMRKPEEGETK